MIFEPSPFGLLFLVAPFSVAAAAQSGPVRCARLVLPDPHRPVIDRIAQVFVRQVARRCTAKVVTSGKGEATVELAIRPGIGAEGFAIAGDDGSPIRIVGNDERGLLYGVGKFLRTSRYDQGGFIPSAWRGTSVPKGVFRALYPATHFGNFYEAAPVTGGLRPRRLAFPLEETAVPSVVPFEEPFHAQLASLALPSGKDLVEFPRQSGDLLAAPLLGQFGTLFIQGADCSNRFPATGRKRLGASLLPGMRVI